MRLQLTAILCAFAGACTLNGDPIETNGEGGSTSTDASASSSATNALTDGMTSTSGMTNASTSTSDGSDDQNGSSDGQGTGNDGFATTAESSSSDSGNIATESSGGSSSGGTTGEACGVESDDCDNLAPCCETFACIGGSCVACIAEGDPCNPNGGEPCCAGLTCVGGALGMAAMCS